jgi:hypothetical protein
MVKSLQTDAEISAICDIYQAITNIHLTPTIYVVICVEVFTCFVAALTMVFAML